METLNPAANFSFLQVAVPAVLGIGSALLTTWAMLSKYREKVDQLEKCNSQQRLSTLEGKFEALQHQLNNLAHNSPNNYMQSSSPLSLNENGKRLLHDSDAQRYVDDHFDELFQHIKQKVDAKQAYSAYDVQEYATETINRQSDSPEFKPLKDFAFKEGIRLPIIQQVAGLYLRDKALTALGFDLDSYYKSDGDGHEHTRDNPDIH